MEEFSATVALEMYEEHERPRAVQEDIYSISLRTGVLAHNIYDMNTAVVSMRRMASQARAGFAELLSYQSFRNQLATMSLASVDSLLRPGFSFGSNIAATKLAPQPR
jgi:hypothetical protein